MPPFTRRRALQAAVGLAVGLAGCNDTTTGESGTQPDAPARRETDGEQFTRDPDRVVLRAAESDSRERVAWFARGPDDVPTDGRTVSRADRTSDGLIADRATAETFTVDAVAETEISDSPATVREFVAATDFETETLLVERMPVAECYRLELCSIDWSDDAIATGYARVIRDYDVRCEADARVSHVTVARLPVALDPETVRKGSTHVSSDGCAGGGQRPGESGAMVATTSGATETDTPPVSEPTTATEEGVR